MVLLFGIETREPNQGTLETSPLRSEMPTINDNYCFQDRFRFKLSWFYLHMNLFGWVYIRYLRSYCTELCSLFIVHISRVDYAKFKCYDGIRSHKDFSILSFTSWPRVISLCRLCSNLWCMFLIKDSLTSTIWFAPTIVDSNWSMKIHPFRFHYRSLAFQKLWCHSHCNWSLHQDGHFPPCKNIFNGQETRFLLWENCWIITNF